MSKKENNGLPEELRVDESFRNKTEDNVSVPEETKVNELNEVNIQSESDKLEDLQNGNQTKNTSSDSGKSAAKSKINNALIKLLTGAIVSVGAILFVINIVANKIPESKLIDLYVGAEYIEYCFEISDMADYKLTLSVYNDWFSVEIPVHEGENIGTVTGLSPMTQYKFKVSGNCGYGQTSLISKSITTAGNKPSAEIRGISYTVTDAGSINLSYKVRLTDPDKHIQSCDIVWLYNDGTASGSRETPAENGDYQIENFDGSGTVDFSLYCTINGTKLLYSSGSVDIELSPRITFDLAGTENGPKLMVKLLPFGSEIKTLRVHTYGYDFDVTIPPSSYALYEHLFTDLNKKKAYDINLTCVYEKNGKEYTEKLKKTLTAQSPDIEFEVLSFHDGGNYAEFNFAYTDRSDSVTRTDLLISDGVVTRTISDVDLSKRVTVSGLTLGKHYTNVVRFYIGDVYISSDAFEFTTDYDVKTAVSLNVDNDVIVCKVVCDDIYGYYSNITVTLTAPDKTVYNFVYIESEGTYSCSVPEGMDNTRYILTVKADSEKPSDMTIFGSSNVTIYEEAVIY